MQELRFSGIFTAYHGFSFQHSKYRVINKDQWCNVLEFSRLIHTDLSNYDEDGACESSAVCLLVSLALTSGFFAGPVLLDEFVEWYKENSAATSQQSSILSTSMQSSSASSLHKSMHMWHLIVWRVLGCECAFPLHYAPFYLCLLAFIFFFSLYYVEFLSSCSSFWARSNQGHTLLNSRNCFPAVLIPYCVCYTSSV